MVGREYLFALGEVRSIRGPSTTFDWRLTPLRMTSRGFKFRLRHYSKNSRSFASLRMTNLEGGRPHKAGHNERDLGCGLCWRGEECHLLRGGVERVGVCAARIAFVAIVNAVL